MCRYVSLLWKAWKKNEGKKVAKAKRGQRTPGWLLWWKLSNAVQTEPMWTRYVLLLEQDFCQERSLAIGNGTGVVLNGGPACCIFVLFVEIPHFFAGCTDSGAVHVAGPELRDPLHVAWKTEKGNGCCCMVDCAHCVRSVRSASGCQWLPVAASRAEVSALSAINESSRRAVRCAS